MNGPELITIGDGWSRCVLCPQAGGSIVSWTVGGQDMLRNGGRDSDAAFAPLELGSFPLVPYSNRIGDAQFEWAGKPVHITPNFPPEPHAIHGIAWKSSWAVAAANAQQCTIVMEHEADAQWPWSFAASQTLELAEGALRIVSTAINRSSQPVPLSFGHHPYFDSQGASLDFTAASVLMSGDDALPTRPLDPDGIYDFRNGGEVEGRVIDHCYAGWNGHARISWANRSLALEIESDLKAAVVYIPQSGSVFCFEPVAHVNNALNRPDLEPNMPKIAPGAAFESVTTFKAKQIDMP